MFGKKKPRQNIAEIMTGAYHKAQAQEDAGQKLLQLTALNEGLASAMAENAYELNWRPFFLYPPLAGAAIGGPLGATGLLDMPDVTSLAGEIAAWAGAGVAGSLMGGLLTLVGGMEYFMRKSKEDHNFRYVRDIAPHLPTLQALSLKVKSDMQLLTSEECAMDLQQSSAFKDVLKAHPDLVTVFKCAQLKKPLPDIDTATPEADKPRKLQL